MSQTVLVTGAGVDKTSGLDLPLAADLLPAINHYLNNTSEGKAVETLIRSKIPGLRFSFSKFINTTIKDITNRDHHQLKETVTRIQTTINELSDNTENQTVKKQGKLLVLLFNKLQEISINNCIDEPIRSLIDEVFGARASQFNLDDTVIDLHKTSISDTFKSILKHTLEQGISAQTNPVARALISDVLDIEKLLIEKFLGFYNNKLSDMKSYVYIAWVLWAYLAQRDKQIQLTVSPMPFYSKIPDGWKGITLNYTSFLETRLTKDNALYFHGGLTSFVRMDNRQLLPFDDYQNSSPIELLKSQICDNWKFNDDHTSQSVCVIPSLIPPLRLKPILSKEYIKIWHNAGQWLEKTNCIVIVGYSLNTADEHFNDLLRGLGNKEIFVIGPDVLSPNYKKRVSAIWGVSLEQGTNTSVQKKNAFKVNHITLIEAIADDIDLKGISKT